MSRPSTAFGARNFTSQCHQDAWAYDNVFHPLLAAGATNDVAAPTFVEFGARDGKRNSNSYFFEKSLGWRGLLVEAGSDDIAALRRNRHCIFNGKSSCLLGGVADDDGTILHHKTYCTGAYRSCRAEERVIVSGTNVSAELAARKGMTAVKSITLNGTLSALGMTRVGLLSADCEGCEWGALSTFDFARWMPQLVVLELQAHGLAQKQAATAKLKERLYSFGYHSLKTGTSNKDLDAYFISDDVRHRLPPPCLDHLGCTAKSERSRRSSVPRGANSNTLDAKEHEHECLTRGEWVRVRPSVRP